MAESTYNYIGQSVKKLDNKELVTGAAQYVSDIKLPNMLIGKILRSPYAHAKIKRVDVSKAKALPGVVDVLTGQDLEGLANPFGKALVVDQRLLALDKVRYVGDEVAVVAAETEQIADDALELIDVDYEILPVLTDPEEALKPGAPLIHEGVAGVEGNVASRHKVRAGDIEKAFREADVVFKERYRTTKQQATPMETHQALSAYDGMTGRLTVWHSTQSAHVDRTMLAGCLGIPENKIRVIKPFVGGAFGHKIGIFPFTGLSALLAMRTGRPVRIAMTRKEEFMATESRHPQIRDIEIAMKKDGTILGWKENIIQDSGAYASFGPAVLILSSAMTIGPYKIPALHMDGALVYTNKAYSGAFRGFGNPQATFARESMLDKVAKGLGIDPLELRLKNCVKAEDLPHTTVNGLKFKTLAIQECIEKVAKAVNYEERRKENKPNRGIGISCMIEWSSCRWNPMLDADTGAAVIHVEPDGSVLILSDACDSGQGHATIFAQIVADELGVTPDKVATIMADTDVTPHGLGTWGSRTAVVTGTAVKRAATDAKDQLFRAAAHMLEASADDLEARDNKIYVKGSPQKLLPMAQVAGSIHYLKSALPPDMETGAIVGKGTFDTPTELTNKDGIGHFTVNYCNSCHIAIVDVDPDTGKVEIVDYGVAEDVGRSINPEFVKGQLQGGFSQGLGYGVGEDLMYDESGNCLNPSFMDYQIPTSWEVPMLDEKIYEVEPIDPEVPDGQKGIGESALTNPAAAIANAVFDATGVQITSLPISPEKVFQAVRSKGIPAAAS